jgi:MFS family permease
VIITLYTGGVVNFGFTAVFDPLAKEFGWSYAQISLASSLRGLEVGLLSAVVGLLVDRLGPRKLILGGTVLIFLGYLVLSGVSSLPMFYAAFALIALGMSACTGTVLLTAVTHWFSRRAGIATGIVASGFGLGGTIVPVVTRLIDTYQWRMAMVIVGLGVLVICLPLAFIVRHRPEDYGYLPDGDTAESIQARSQHDGMAGVEEPGILARKRVIDVSLFRCRRSSYSYHALSGQRGDREVHCQSGGPGTAPIEHRRTAEQWSVQQPGRKSAGLFGQLRPDDSGSARFQRG